MSNTPLKGPHKRKCNAGKSKETPKCNGNLKKRWTDQLFAIEIGVVKRIAKAVNSPFALETLKRLEVSDWHGIANAPFPDTESDTFPMDYLLQQILRKNPRLPLGIDRKAVAIQKWRDAERACKTTNELLEKCTSDFTRNKTASLILSPQLLGQIRANIKKLLGPLDRKALDRIESGSRFGPGATFHCSGKDLTPNKRLEAEIGLTPMLARFAAIITPRGWKATSRGFAFTRGSRACTVSKDATTDRFIAIEPSLNMRWQLGIGGLIRHRLRLFGLDLDTQADVNRARVRSAERLGRATIDLQSASDSVALMLIRFLFPADWVHLLEIFRSPEMKLGDEWVVLEKISSMGNGYTFELESLLFYAVALCFDDDPAVFGDDIIVNQSCASDVIRTLNVLGFTVNRKKTFLAGSFFESCGVDVWRGKDVRPFFLKKETDDHDLTSSLIRMANAIRRYASSSTSDYGCDSRFLPAWLYALSRDEDARKTYAPEGVGDAGVVRNWDECTPKILPSGHQGFKARVWHRRPETVNVTDTYAGLMAALDGPPNQRVVESRGSGQFSFRRVQHGRDTWYERSEEAPYVRYRVRKETKNGIGPNHERFGGYGAVWTQGLDASLTHQTIRGRTGAGQLQDLPVFVWQDIGPWV